MARGALLCSQARSLADDGLTVIAGKIYEEVLKEDPVDSDALLGLSLLLFHQDSARAVTWLKRAVFVAPEDAARWRQLATAHYKRGNFRPSRRAFRVAVALDPATTESWLGLGDSLSADGEPTPVAYRYAALLSAAQSAAHFRLPSVVMANKPPLWAETLVKIADHPAKIAAFGMTFTPRGNPEWPTIVAQA